MATFKAVVLPHQVKSDKTVRIKILVTHNRVRKYIDSGLTATTADLTKELKLKVNSQFKDDLNALIKTYRDKCNHNFERVEQMDCARLVDFLTSKTPTLDFYEFAASHIEYTKWQGRITTSRDYTTAINALKRFTGSDKLPVSNITSRFLKSFVQWIPLNPITNKKTEMSRAPSHYLGSIRTLYNKMKEEFNDEDTGVILIPGSPFTKFRVPKPPVTKKRSISAKEIKGIYMLTDAKGRGSIRTNLARDCFILSFFLIGMNSADLYDCTNLKGNWITYQRKKTRTRRDDSAEIKIEVPPEIKPLLKKYADKSGKRVFNFYQHYATESSFNNAINKGLKNIIPDLEFYSARHSWATIAQNDCSIDKYIVHEALNHVNEKIKITEIYLRKDWSRINKANRKVIDFVLKSKAT